MSYRGEDLDLRTKQSWHAGRDHPGEQENASRSTSSNGPIWVDDAVLASANHAYDIALAHRAGEVRLEHFLHAMTRIDAAAEALEARGVRVAALRRESATIIASEIPVGLGNGKATPRRSDEFAEVLRAASIAAQRHNSAATVDDVLNVLFDPRREMPGLGLLFRHTLKAGVRETLEQFPPLSRYPGEMRYMPVPTDRYYRVPAGYAVPPMRVYRDERSETATDVVQNSRIEVLEQMVRSLGDDLASERQLVSSMLKDLSRDTQAQRDDQGRLHSGLYDRIQELERALTENRGGANADGVVDQLLNLEVMLEQRLKDINQGWSSLSGRISDLEAGLRTSGGDEQAGGQLQRIASRLDAIEDAVLKQPGAGMSDLAERLTALVGQSDGLSGPILARFDGAAEAQQAGLKAATEVISERLSAVEQALVAEIETAAAKHSAYAKDLGEVHDALMKLNQNQHTLAGSIDQWRTEAAGDVATISNRIIALDRDTSQPVETLNRLSANMESLNRFLLDRYHRRHRFLYWLFGTDDWIGASWPSQTAAADAARGAVVGEDKSD